jgi:hypothetical protein
MGVLRLILLLAGVLYVIWWLNQPR